MQTQQNCWNKAVLYLKLKHYVINLGTEKLRNFKTLLFFTKIVIYHLNNFNKNRIFLTQTL